MFIKFGDSTKKIIIKESIKKDSEENLNKENMDSVKDFNTLYLDQDSEDRRIKALINYEKEE